MPEQNLFDSDDAAHYLGGFSSNTLRKWRMTGRGPRFVRIGAAIRYRRADLDAFIESRTYRTTTEADQAAAVAA